MWGTAPAPQALLVTEARAGLRDAKPSAAAPIKFFQRHSPVRPSAYVESVAGQVRPLVRALAGCGFDNLEPSRRDAVCCPGWQREKTTRESSCWLCCCDNCRRRAHGLVGRAAVAVELGLRLAHHETAGSFVPPSPRRRTRPPCQRVTLCIPHP